MLRLLDTDIIIDLQRKHPPSTAWFSTVDLSDLAVPGFVAMELYQAARNKAEARSADSILRLLPIVWPSDVACGVALADFRALHLSHNLGLIDALIGAATRALGAILCTFNVKHFKAVPGLTVEQPYLR
jgi:predicted nucleic acid-binding protein